MKKHSLKKQIRTLPFSEYQQHRGTVKSKPGTGMKNTILATLLALLCSCAIAVAQTQTTPSEADRHSEELDRKLEAGQLEEIAMCHHAIKAAHYDGVALDQNPYYRYILYSPEKGHGANVYPIPERCKGLETSLVLNYTKLSADAKAIEDKTIRDAVGMTISDMATDAQFLTIVINKMNIEGERAVFWESRDKDIP